MEKGIWLSFKTFRILSLENIKEGQQSFRANRGMLMFRFRDNLKKRLNASRNNLKYVCFILIIIKFIKGNLHAELPVYAQFLPESRHPPT